MELRDECKITNLESRPSGLLSQNYKGTNPHGGEPGFPVAELGQCSARADEVVSTKLCIIAILHFDTARGTHLKVS